MVVEATMIEIPKRVGETKITGKNQISLPAEGMRELGWERGDELVVKTFGDDMMLLVRRPKDWAAAFSGKMGDVFGDHEDTLRYLDEERRSWERD
jgi:bifunctional DNA-binding transcriptional regulator/antitoxin component of YhaV-PrlF toxin-antitoxin module